MIGFIYALINSSVPGLVKVGRTDRDPELRARELSAHTGVAAPFLVAFQRQVNDSETAERFIHALLESKGVRVSPDREFFQAPLHEIVQAIVSYHEDAECMGAAARAEPDMSDAARTSDEGEYATALEALRTKLEKFGERRSPPDVAPWQSLLAEAHGSAYGFEDRLQDYGEALRLYTLAAALGSGKAHRKIGEMYERGEGVVVNPAEALREYKRGLQKGEHGCYAAMALLFRKLRNYGNEAKCWDKFFEAVICRLQSVKEIKEEARRLGGLVTPNGDWWVSDGRVRIPSVLLYNQLIQLQEGQEIICDFHPPYKCLLDYYLEDVRSDDADDVLLYLTNLGIRQPPYAENIAAIRLGCESFLGKAKWAEAALAWLDAEFPVPPLPSRA